jgi:hypothetical protein
MQMRIFISLLVLFLFSCRSHSRNDHLFVQPDEWPAPDSVLNKVKQEIDKGNPETFSINNAKFRFQKNPNAKNLYNLQVFEDKAWVNNLLLAMPKEAFFLTQDFDLDHNFDLSFLEYGDLKIYFFDKDKKRFNPGPMQFSYDCALLDSSKLIYGVNNHSSDNWDIDIFSIKNRSMAYLYKAKLYLKDNTNNGSFAITKALLYKCKDSEGRDTVLIQKIEINKQFGDFSLLQFMKDIAHNGAYR